MTVGIGGSLWIALFLAVPALPQATRQKQTGKSGVSKSVVRGLTIKQIEELVAIRTPDTILAQEIQSRGVVETVTREAVARLKERGAGVASLAILDRQIPRAILTIQTTAGAEVVLDGSGVGRAEANGQLTVSDLDPGNHSVRIRKANFHDKSVTVDLPANRTTALDALLEWAVGFLTVQVDVAEAQIRINGILMQTGSIPRFSIPPGPLRVVATAPLRKTAAEDLVVEAGKDAKVSLSLPWDEGALRVLAEQILTLFRFKQYDAVIRQAGVYFRTGAKDNEVLAAVAVSHLETGNYALFRGSARSALAAGATLIIKMQHHHPGALPDLHPAELQVTKGILRFQPEGFCNVDAVEVSVDRVRVQSGDTSVVLRRSSPRKAIAVKLFVPNPSNPRKEIMLSLIKEAGDIRKAAEIREFLKGLQP